MRLLAVAGPLLALALALGVVAQRQSWRPTLGQTLAVGAGLRVTVALLAHANHWQPFDFAYDFPHAGENVLQHRDPLLNVRPYGWNYLPTMAYVFAAQLKIAAVTGLPWTIAGRLVPVAADLMVAVLVGNISGGQKRLRRFQYATNPVAILVASVHGQMETLCLAFGVAAFVAARAGRGYRAGLLAAVAVSAKSWPVLLLPGLMLALPDLKGRIRALLTLSGVLAALFLSMPLLVGTAPSRLPDAAHRLLSYRSASGEWGWTAIGVWIRAAGPGSQPPNSWAGIGALLTILALATTMYMWRRADPVDLTAAVLTVFLVVTAGFGSQYLLWPVPFLIARPTRMTFIGTIAASVWATFGYLQLTLSDGTYQREHQLWVNCSVLVILALLAALPWSRRKISQGPGRQLDQASYAAT